MMSMLLYLALLLCSCMVSSRSVNDLEWEEWKLKYGKHYDGTDEEITRREIWRENKERVHNHNNRLDKSFTLELNRNADQILVQKKQHTIYRHDWAKQIRYHDNHLTFAPSQFDWRTRGAVTPVHNQGRMGDTEAIVATECVESYNFIKTGRLVDLSITETEDCCGSHLLYNIFECIHNIGGLCSTAAYPPHRTGTGCRNDSCTPVVQIEGGKKVPSGNEDALLQVVLQVPVMAAVDAGETSFQMYESGIYDEPNCSSTRLDHVVQIVGYGTQGAGKDYWIVRNSWGFNPLETPTCGVDWGMKGYILMSRNKNNQRGIAAQAIYPY